MVKSRPTGSIIHISSPQKQLVIKSDKNNYVLLRVRIHFACIDWFTPSVRSSHTALSSVNVVVLDTV